MRALGIAVAAALTVGGCSLLFDGKDLHGRGGGDMGLGDMAGGGGGGGTGGGDMAGGGGGGTGGGDMGHKLTLSFTKSTPITVGAAPYALVAGDFDHDGHLDVASANANGNSVSFAFGNGTTFTPVINITVPPSGTGNGCSPYAIAAGRFDGDQTDDVVVTCTDQNNANSVYFIKGSTGRTFTPLSVLSTTASASFEGITVGDFDTDGKLDFAVSSYSGNNVWIAGGNGDGTFGAATMLAAGTGPYGLATGDVNGDGRDDLVAFNYGDFTINVLLQATTGGLGAAMSHATGGYSGDGVLVDLDHDGTLDIVTADESNDQLDVFLNSKTGTGSFPNTPPAYSTHPTPEQVATADFDGDGIMDIVTTDTITNSIDVLLGVGDGTLGTAIQTTGLPNASGLVVGDFTGDGLPDIVVCNDSNAGSITLVVNSSH